MRNRLRQVRQARGFSLFKLGVAVGRTPETMRLYERGEGYPRGDVMFRIAKALGVKVADIWPDVEAERRA